MINKRKIILVIVAIVGGILGLRYLRKRGTIPAIPFIAPDEPTGGIDMPTSMGERARNLLSSITKPFGASLGALKKLKLPKVFNFKDNIRKLRTKATSATYSVRKRMFGVAGLARNKIKKTYKRLTKLRSGSVSLAKTHSRRTYSRVARVRKTFRRVIKSRFTTSKRHVRKARSGVGRSLSRVKGRITKLKSSSRRISGRVTGHYKKATKVLGRFRGFFKR